MMGLFTRHQRTEQAQPTQDAIIAITSYESQCAWCNQEAGIEQGNGSHGICDYHSNLQYEQYQAARQSRTRGAR